MREQRKHVNSRKIALCLCLSVILGGCGRSDGGQQTSGGNIELLDPVGSAVEYEEAAFRNLYNAKIYSAAVYPYVVEYTFAADEKFADYAALPGEKVSKKEALIYSDSESVDKQIEDMEEMIRTMEEEFATAKEELEESLEEPRRNVQNLASIVDAYVKAEPDPYEPGGEVSGGDASSDPEYIKWQEEYDRWQAEFTKWEGQYRILAHSIDTREVQFQQRTQLYELDHAYYAQQLADLKAQKKKSTIVAGMAGEVVAIGFFSYGDSVSKETPVVAVGDTEHKILKCNYIDKSALAGAEDIYALIDGVRYEVTHQPIGAEEYNELTAKGETVYSTFELQGAGDEVQAGDFAVIVLMTKRAQQVLSVPVDAIHKDEAGRYVYVLKDGESVYTSVTTGMSDGVYTEVKEGLSEGDRVLLTGASAYGSQTATVEMGSFHSTFQNSGFMFYPSSRMVQNPIEYGTVYFQEMLVAQYQHVEKGDVIARVRVQGDEIELQRQQIKLQRLEERLRDLQKENAESNEKAIKQKQEEIAKVRELIEEMNEDAATTQIKADRSGIVIWVANYQQEDILWKDANLIEIADEDTCYVVVENTNQLLNYGNEVTITYQDKEGNSKTTGGTVANLSQAGVSSALMSEYSLILLPEDVIGDMAVTTQGYEGWWTRNRFQVTAVIREMNHVLVVPKKAVKEYAGRTYVNVIDEEGNVTACSFVAGGYDDTNYWVIEGLSEGMKVCLE